MTRGGQTRGQILGGQPRPERESELTHVSGLLTSFFCLFIHSFAQTVSQSTWVRQARSCAWIFDLGAGVVPALRDPV